MFQQHRGWLCLFASFLLVPVYMPGLAFAAIGDLKITEIMYNPPDQGNILSDDLEFLELKNTGTEAIDLSGLQFTESIIYTFPGGKRLDAGKFFILASNPFVYNNRYGSLPDGIYEGQLRNSGEKIEISDAQGNVVISVTYSDESPWPTSADGLGFSLVPVDPNPKNDQNEFFYWRASSNIGGSPRTDDPPLDIPAIVVSEALTNGDQSQSDFIELFNPTNAAVNIGGWYLTDDPKTPMKYKIPANTGIPAGGYLVFNENQFNPNPGVNPSFALSANGDQVYLFSANASNVLSGYSHGFDFEAAENGVSFGRHINSEGTEHFTAMSQTTKGAANAAPKVGDVVITEIMYNTAVGQDEFIEIANRTDQAIKLYDPLRPANTWQVSGIGYDLPQNIELPAHGVLLVVSIDPQMFRTKYNVPSSAQIVGPFTGALQNDGENIELNRPANPDGTEIPRVVVDAVRYNDKAPWPMDADGEGFSLERVSPNLYGNEPTSWKASEKLNGTPGLVSFQTSVNRWMMF